MPEQALPDQWAEYEPFDRAGLTEWTHVYECAGCTDRVAVYDPEGIHRIVLCAEHSGTGKATVDYPPEGFEDDDDYDFEEDEKDCEDA